MARRRWTATITDRLFERSTTTPAIVLKMTPGSAKATMIPETAVDDLLMPFTVTSRARLMMFCAVCEIAWDVHMRRKGRFRSTATNPRDDCTSTSVATSAATARPARIVGGGERQVGAPS